MKKSIKVLSLIIGFAICFASLCTPALAVSKTPEEGLKEGFRGIIARYNLETDKCDEFVMPEGGAVLSYGDGKLYVLCRKQFSEEEQRDADIKADGKPTDNYKPLILQVNPESMEVEKTIYVPECGDSRSCLYSDGLLYLPAGTVYPFSYVEDARNTKVFVVNPEDSSIFTLDTGQVAPDYAVDYNDYIIVLNDPGNSYHHIDEPKEPHITMVNKHTCETIDYQPDYIPRIINVKGNELYVTDDPIDTPNREKGSQMMYVYSLPNFELKRQFDISPNDKENYLNRGFFVVNK